MFHRAMLSLVLFCFWAYTARADLPPPSHLKNVDPRVRFEGIEDYPDHVFFLRYYDVHGNPVGTRPNLIELKNMEVLSIKARRIYHMTVLVMSRTEFDKRKADDPSLSWLKGEPLDQREHPLSWLAKIPEVKYASIQAPPTVASVFASESPLAEYRIAFSAGRLVVDVLSIPEPNYTPPLERPLVWLFVAAALASTGVWFVRRRRLQARAYANSEQDSLQG